MYILHNLAHYFLVTSDNIGIHAKCMTNSCSLALFKMSNYHPLCKDENSIFELFHEDRMSSHFIWSDAVLADLCTLKSA